MIPEIDIWRAANLMLKRYGEKALEESEARADELTLEIGELGEAGFDLSLTGFGEFELGELFAETTQGRTDPDDAPELPAGRRARVAPVMVFSWFPLARYSAGASAERPSLRSDG